MWKASASKLAYLKKVYKDRSYSLRNKLRSEGKSKESFEVMMMSLTMEELLGLKLELTIRSTAGARLYNLPIWRSLNLIVKDAMIKFAVSACANKRNAANLLGLREDELNSLMIKYEIDSYFNNTRKKKEIV